MAHPGIELLDSLLGEEQKLRFGDDTGRDALMKRASMIIRRVAGEKSPYLSDLASIGFYPMYAPATNEAKRSTWQKASGRLRNLINTLKEELELFPSDQAAPITSGAIVSADAQNPSIFVVHGHDEELKQTVARTLERLGLDPIILHEKPNQGRTIIEKFSDHAAVGFAVVLLSADDVVLDSQSKEKRRRARQNVILELGFFLGRLGRERVAVVFKPHEAFEMPSDYAGVLFIEYDSVGAWRFQVAKELKACGYQLNLDAIL